MKKKIENLKLKVFLIFLVVAIVGLIIFLFGKNGKKESPFEIANITVTSSGNGEYVDDNTEEEWNLKLFQNNDIYVSFGLKKNMDKVDKKNARIKEAYINNIKVIERPFREGKIESYKLAGKEDVLFDYLPINKIEEKLSFSIVEENANTYNCEVNKNGGQIAFSIINKEIKDQIYGKRKELAFDGTLFKEADIPLDELKFKISFDFNILTEAGIKYVKTIELNMPQGNIVENGFELNENVELLDNSFIYTK